MPTPGLNAQSFASPAWMSVYKGSFGTEVRKAFGKCRRAGSTPHACRFQRCGPGPGRQSHPRGKWWRAGGRCKWSCGLSLIRRARFARCVQTQNRVRLMLHRGRESARSSKRRGRWQGAGAGRRKARRLFRLQRRTANRGRISRIIGRTGRRFAGGRPLRPGRV